jgi:hypothetical protein
MRPCEPQASGVAEAEHANGSLLLTDNGTAEISDDVTVGGCQIYNAHATSDDTNNGSSQRSPFSADKRNHNLRAALNAQHHTASFLYS